MPIRATRRYLRAFVAAASAVGAPLLGRQSSVAVADRIQRLAAVDRNQLRLVAEGLSQGGRVQWGVEHAKGYMQARGLESALSLLPLFDQPGQRARLVSVTIEDTAGGPVMHQAVTHDV